jgi:predicted nucleic acid-binding protein
MPDKNFISELIRNPQGRAAKRIAKVGEDNICTSIIVAAELRYGCAKSGSKRLLKAVQDLLSEIDVLPFDVLTTAVSARNWKQPESRSAATTCSSLPTPTRPALRW